MFIAAIGILFKFLHLTITSCTRGGAKNQQNTTSFAVYSKVLLARSGLLKFSRPNLVLLKYMIDFLYRVSSFHEVNMMSPANLAIGALCSDLVC